MGEPNTGKLYNPEKYRKDTLRTEISKYQWKRNQKRFP